MDEKSRQTFGLVDKGKGRINSPALSRINKKGKDMSDAQTKVSRAITKLIISHPFFGSMALTLNIQESKNHKTMATNGKDIFWSADFVDRHSQDEITGVIAHEIMHVVMKHPLRLEGRDHKRFNIACDYAINPALTAESNFTLPKDRLEDPAFEGMYAEKIYNLLPDPRGGGDGQGDSEGGDQGQGQGQGQGQDQGQGDGMWGEVLEPLNDNGGAMSDAEKSQMEAAIDQQIMAAAASAKAIGSLPASIDAMVTEMKKPKVDFADVLKRHYGGDQPDDYSWRRPNKRMYQHVRVFAPSIGRIGCGKVTIIIDTSGSMSDGELAQCLGEMNNLSIEFNPEEVNVITFDTKVRTHRTYQAGEEITDIKVGGRGGTDVLHVWEYMADHGVETDVMIFLTDMGFYHYPPTPPYPVLWVDTANTDVIPKFGDKVSIPTV
jgi:predicted metal-dependent peptidase